MKRTPKHRVVRGVHHGTLMYTVFKRIEDVCHDVLRMLWKHKEMMVRLTRVSLRAVICAICGALAVGQNPG